MLYYVTNYFTISACQRWAKYLTDKKVDNRKRYKKESIQKCNKTSLDMTDGIHTNFCGRFVGSIWVI